MRCISWFKVKLNKKNNTFMTNNLTSILPLSSCLINAYLQQKQIKLVIKKCEILTTFQSVIQCQLKPITIDLTKIDE